MEDLSQEMDPDEKLEKWLANRRAHVSEMDGNEVAFVDQAGSWVRDWAVEVGADPLSEEFRRAWCVAHRVYHQMMDMAYEEIMLMAKAKGAVDLGGVLHDTCKVFGTVGVTAWMQRTK